MTTAGDPHTNPRGEAGSVTAEFAVGLPGVVATILLVLGALTAGATYVECQEAARAGAREAMLHGSTAAAQEAAQQVAGPRAQITVSTQGRWITVRVHKSLIVDALPVRISAQMVAPMEPQGMDLGRGP